MNGISTLVRETPKAPLLPLQCEDAVRRQPSANREAGSHQTPDVSVPWFWISSLQKYEIKTFVA